MAGTSPLSLSLSFFLVRVRYINPEFSAKDRHANTREEGKGTKRALAIIYLRVREKRRRAFCVVAWEERERERERIQFSLVEEFL